MKNDYRVSFLCIVTQNIPLSDPNFPDYSGIEAADFTLPGGQSLNTHYCHPGDTLRHWGPRCRTFCCPSQSENQHRSRTPTASWNRSASQSCPEVGWTFPGSWNKMASLHKSKNWVWFQGRLWKTTHPTHRRLHDGVETALWHVNVRRYPLLRDDLIKPVSAAC